MAARARSSAKNNTKRVPAKQQASAMKKAAPGKQPKAGPGKQPKAGPGKQPKAGPGKALAKPAAPPKQHAKQPAAVLRGATLVELAIPHLEIDAPRPLDAATLAALRLPDGRPLPPSLVRLLAHDAEHLGVLEGSPPRLALRSFTEMMQQEFDPRTADLFSEFEKLLPASCLVVPGGSDSRRFVYFGTPDAYGEYPVFALDTDELPWVGLAYPGLDVYLADGNVVSLPEDGYIGAFRDERYGPMMVAQARANFAGFKGLDFGGGDTEHVDGDSAVEAAMVAAFPDLASAVDDGDPLG